MSWLGRVTQSRSANYRWRFEPFQGCSTFPEVEVNAEGTPCRGQGPGAEVQGFLDAHVHVTAFEFLGGRFHCGRPWSPYGVMDALKDCPDHAPNGQFAVAENLLSYGTLTGTHSNDGWPNFDGWPKYFSLTHEGTYWKGIERAWRGGLRIMVADLVENRALCEIYPLKKNSCLDMDSLRLQATDAERAPGLHRRPVQGAGQGVLPHREESRGGARRHPRGQAGRDHRRRDVAAVRLPLPRRRGGVLVRTDRPGPPGAVGPRRAIHVSRAQVRQRLRRDGDGQRLHRRARERRQQVDDGTLVAGRVVPRAASTISRRRTCRSTTRGGTSSCATMWRRCSAETCRRIPPARFATSGASPISGST